MSRTYLEPLNLDLFVVIVTVITEFNNRINFLRVLIEGSQFKWSPPYSRQPTRAAAVADWLHQNDACHEHPWKTRMCVKYS